MATGTEIIRGDASESLEIPTEPIWRLTVDQYHQMIRLGILTEDDQVELLEGWLVTKMGKNPPHRIANRRLRRAIESRLPQGWYLESQEPLTAEESEPEPDAYVARGESEEYPTGHPRPEDIVLVIEVSDTTLARDRTIKKRIYARGGVAIYWIINLIERQIEVYSNPTGSDPRPEYRLRKDYGSDEAVPLVIGGQLIGEIPVRELLPP